MYVSLTVSYWLVVPLAIVAGAFFVRVFIILHDCGHGPPPTFAVVCQLAMAIS